MVAACISAETGVGPAIASASQVCRGNWADLPNAPPTRSRVIRVAGGISNLPLLRGQRHRLLDVDGAQVPPHHENAQ